MVGTVGSPAKFAAAKEAGCDAVIDYSNATWPEEVLKATGGRKANGLNRLGRTDEAIEYYGRILAFAPDDVDTYIALAEMEIKSSNFTRAIDIYRRGLGFNPENGDLHGRLGSLFLQ